MLSFPFLFSSYCHSVVHRVTIIVSDGCNQSSFVFLHIVFESLHIVFDVSTLSSMPASSLPSSFLETYRLSTSSLGCDALCIVVSFLVLWSICLSSSLVHLRKGLEYLTSGTTRVFIPLIRFLLESFVSSSFLVLRYSFWILSFISTCLIAVNKLIADKMQNFFNCWTSWLHEIFLKQIGLNY